MFFSIVIPVYNRPDEIESLLKCLVEQTYKDFEVIVVESGSELRKSDEVVQDYASLLSITYSNAGNHGPGMSRNHGFALSKGDYFIVLDSDVLLEPDFVEQVYLGVKNRQLDAHGGPDRCHPSFTNIEKAFNYSLTSFLTTGGMRGGKIRATEYYPRSFNMGFSREVYEATRGFKFGFMGEDMELSHRIKSLGFKVGLIPDAYVYHHRKKDFHTFFRYMRFFGKSRINISLHVPGSLRIIHLVPLMFIFFFVFSYVSMFISPLLFAVCKSLLYGYLVAIFVDSTFKNRSAYIGLLSIFAVITQNFGYGIGFAEDFWNRLVLKKNRDLVNI